MLVCIKDEKSLIQQNIRRVLASAVENEFTERLAHRNGCSL